MCLIILGIPAIAVQPGNNSYQYEDGFTMMQFYVSSAIATVGLEITEDTNRIHPIFVRNTRSGQVLEEKLRKSIDNVENYIVFQKYDNIKYLCMLMLHPQNKYRNIVIYPQQFNSYFDNLNIDENIEKLNDYNDDNVDEIVGDDLDANLYFPRDENTEV